MHLAITTWAVLNNAVVAPVLNTPETTATTISLSWTQSGSDVDNYTVSSNYTIRQCGPGVMSGSISQSVSDGSARSYELSGLEEDSDYTITLTANSSTGTASSQISATTNSAGIGHTLLLLNNYSYSSS